MTAAEDRSPSAPDLLSTPGAGRHALRGSLMRFGGYGAGTLLALVAQPLLARHLGRVGYGQYTLAIAIATVAAGFTEGGVNTVALREYTTLTGAARDHALANVMGVRMLLNVLNVSSVVAFALVAGYAPMVVLAAALAACGLALQVTQIVVSAPLQGDLRLGWVAGADVLRQLVATMLIVLLVVAGKHVVWFVAVLIPANAAALGLTRFKVGKRMPKVPRFDLGASVQLLRDTLPFAVAIALGVAYFRLSVIFVSLMADQQQLGVYSYSYRIVEVLIGLPSILIGAAYPILVRTADDNPARLAQTTRRMFDLAVIAGVWVAVCIELAAGFGVGLIGGHSAAPAALVLRIQGLAVIGTFIASSLVFPLLAVRGYRGTMFANACGLLATVVTSLSLIPLLGARGAAIGTVAGELVLAFATGVALSRVRRGLALRFSTIPISLVAGGVGLAAGHFVGVHPLVGIMVATVVYLAGIAVLGRFPPEISHVFGWDRASS